MTAYRSGLDGTAVDRQRQFQLVAGLVLCFIVCFILLVIATLWILKVNFETNMTNSEHEARCQVLHALICSF